MRIFVSYSFKPENSWIQQLVVPLIRCFGHEPVTGLTLDAGTLDEEVKRKMRSSKRVICFTTRAAPRYDENGAITGYDAPQWVEDELMLAHGMDRPVIEFRESNVIRAGASNLHPYTAFERNRLATLLLDLAERVKEWPIGPLNLRLEVPDAIRAAVEQAANAGSLMARITVDEDGQAASEELKVRVQNSQLVIPFWLKPNPNQSIDIEIVFGAQTLVRRGISPSVRDARLELLGGHIP